MSDLVFMMVGAFGARGCIALTLVGVAFMLVWIREIAGHLMAEL